MTATKGKPEWKDREERPYQYRSALQQKPQGVNRATRAVLKHQSHGTLPRLAWCKGSIAAQAAEINHRLKQIEHGRDQRDDPGTRGGELGQPVRNT